MPVSLNKYWKKVVRSFKPSAQANAKTEVQEWAIGIYEGENPWIIKPGFPNLNPVIKKDDIIDTKASFVADPFMIVVDSVWYMFFEIMNSQSRKGEIGLAMSLDGYVWKYEKIVLVEPFHLSYPYVFHWKDDYYMIPESWKAGGVRLYRAKRFPNDWVFLTTILSRNYIADSSPFYYNKRWWMFADTGENISCDTARLYISRELTGPWKEHPSSPIVRHDPHHARPAGRVLVEGERIIRFVQDCAPRYGLKVFGYVAENINLESYSEQPLQSEAILKGTGKGWNSGGMHHIDAHQVKKDLWIACVDGWRNPVENHEK